MAGTQLHVTKDHCLQDIDLSVRNVDVLTRPSVGMKAWVIHKITGLGLLIYLLSHIATMGTAMFMGDETFKRVFDVLFHTPIFEFFDLLILAGIILHALNGIRLIIVEMGYFVPKHKQLFTGVIVVSVILFLWLAIRAF